MWAISPQVRPHAVSSVSGTVQSDPVEPSGQTIYINPGTQQVPFYEVTTGSEASTRVYVSFAGKVVSGSFGEQGHVPQPYEVRIAGEQFGTLVPRRRVDDGIGGGQLVFAV